VSRGRRTDLPETDWATSALCADVPAEIFDAAGARVQTAKAACAHCPVTRQCLRWALSHEVEDEIWGARTPRERRRLSMAFALEPPSTVASVTDKRPPALASIPAVASAESTSGPLRTPAAAVAASTDRPKPQSVDELACGSWIRADRLVRGAGWCWAWSGCRSAQLFHCCFLVGPLPAG